MKLLRELGPLAVGVALFGALIAVLLSQGSVVGNWLLALFLLVHGGIHMTYLVPAPKVSAATAKGPEWAFELDQSRVLGMVGFAPSGQRTVGSLLVAVTVAGFAIAALATIPLIVPASAWPALVVGSSVASLILMGLFFNRNLVIGIAIDLVLLAIAFLSVWLPAV